MKNTLWIILSCSVLLACNEDDLTPKGMVNVSLNGSDWPLVVDNATGSLCIDQRNTLVFYGYGESGFRRSSLGFTNVPQQEGTYPIKALGSDNCNSDVITGSFYFLIADGDVIGDYFKVIEGDDSWLKITAYNSRKRGLKGTFQLSVAYQKRGNSGRKVPDFPDTLHFTQGEFSVVIDELM